MTLALLSPLDELQLTAPAWGIDPSTKRCAVGVVTTSRKIRYDHLVLRQGPEAARIVMAEEDLEAWFRRLITMYGMPGLVVVEQPFAGGMGSKVRVHPQSYYLMAATLSAVFRATGGRADVHTVTPTEWKREGMGDGRGATGKSGILRFAQEMLGFSGDCEGCHANDAVKCVKQGPAHDEADAQVIAIAAARRLART